MRGVVLADAQDKRVGVMTYIDNLTLAEMGENDRDMAESALKESKQYKFGQSLAKATRFMAACVDASLHYCGVHVPLIAGSTEIRARSLDKQMNVQGVKVERRKHHKGSDAWRNGLYIYKDDVVVAFISEPVAVRAASRLIIGAGAPEYAVYTNAKVDYAAG